MRKIETLLIITLLLAIVPTLAQKTTTEVTTNLDNNNAIEMIVNVRDNNEKIPETNKIVEKVITQNNIEEVIYTTNDAFVALLNKENFEKLTIDENVYAIEKIMEYTPILTDAVEIIEVDEVWPIEVNGKNLDGSEASIVIVDTGVDFTHSHLSAKNIAGGNIKCYDFPTCTLSQSDTDIMGHGTNVAGIAAAQGPITNGIAKGANIISTKVFCDGCTTTADWQIRQAIDWAIANKDTYNIKVISISLSTGTTYTGACDVNRVFLSTGVNNAINSGIAVVAGSGNLAINNAIGSPACIDNVIAVGATKDNDEVWPLSNYNIETKLFAPGKGIESTCINQNFCSQSGTSLATPMISGAITILANLNEQTGTIMTPTEYENLLYNTGDPIIALPNTHKRINMLTAIETLEKPFLRGDVNRDGSLNLLDSVTLLDYLFNGGTLGTCYDSSDVNDDGTLSIPDAIMLMNYMYSQNNVLSLAAPFLTPGNDPTTDSLYCF